MSDVNRNLLPRLGRRLTQEEVDKLPEGTMVEVVWSGGNGPHQYRIKRWGDVTLVDIEVDPRGFHPLDFVGLFPPHTMVWRVREPVQPTGSEEAS